MFGNYLMDVSHPEWVAEVVRQCRAAKASTGADGCYTDMLMTTPLFENYHERRETDQPRNRAGMDLP